MIDRLKQALTLWVLKRKMERAIAKRRAIRLVYSSVQKARNK